MIDEPKLLFVIQPHRTGATHRLPVLEAAVDAGYAVSVATAPDSDAWAVLANRGYRLLPVPLTRAGMDPWQQLALIRALVRLYKAERPALVNNVSIKPVIFGGMAARFCNGLRVVSTFPGLGYVFSAAGLKPRLARVLVKILYQLALRNSKQKVIVQNEEDRRVVARLGRLKSDQVHLIGGSGVNVGMYQGGPEPRDRDLITLPARMLKDKGIREFVRAAELLSQRRLSVRMVLVGDVDDENPSSISRNQLESWHTSGIIEWWGYVQCMRDVYWASRAVVLPSYREGLSKVIIEAAASACPVITTDAPGCRDAVIDEETGYIVPVGDSEQLATRIEMIVTDDYLADRLGRGGLALVRREFTDDIVKQRTLDVYSHALAGTGTGVRAEVD